MIDDGVIAKVFYPVFPPDQSAGRFGGSIAWLSTAIRQDNARTLANTERNISGVSTRVLVL